MDYEEAKEYHAQGRKVYRAYCDGRAWGAGQFVEVGDTIGYYTTKAEAVRACKDYEMFDFDRKNLKTFVELCDGAEFDD